MSGAHGSAYAHAATAIRIMFPTAPSIYDFSDPDMPILVPDLPVRSFSLSFLYDPLTRPRISFY